MGERTLYIHYIHIPFISRWNNPLILNSWDILVVVSYKSPCLLQPLDEPIKRWSWNGTIMQHWAYLFMLFFEILETSAVCQYILFRIVKLWYSTCFCDVWRGHLPNPKPWRGLSIFWKSWTKHNLHSQYGYANLHVETSFWPGAGSKKAFYPSASAVYSAPGSKKRPSMTSANGRGGNRGVQQCNTPSQWRKFHVFTAIAPKITGWWQLKEFLCSPRLFGEMIHFDWNMSFFKWVETTN